MLQLYSTRATKGGPVFIYNLQMKSKMPYLVIILSSLAYDIVYQR